METIRSIWDNEGETFDRYTVITGDARHHAMHDALGLSDNPTHPQGFSQWSSAQEGDHLGKRISFKDLPKHIQEHIVSRLS